MDLIGDYIVQGNKSHVELGKERVLKDEYLISIKPNNNAEVKYSYRLRSWIYNDTSWTIEGTWKVEDRETGRIVIIVGPRIGQSHNRDEKGKEEDWTLEGVYTFTISTHDLLSGKMSEIID